MMISSVQAYPYGQSESYATAESFGVTVDFAMSQPQIEYFEQFDIVDSIEVVLPGIGGATAIYFVGDFTLEEQNQLDFELSMLAKQHYVVTSEQYWPREAIYMYSSDFTQVGVCYPTFEPALGYEVVRCYY